MSAFSHASSKPTRGRRWFRWGIAFWITLWIATLFYVAGLKVNLKGCWGAGLFIGAGSVGVQVDTYSRSSQNHSRWHFSRIQEVRAIGSIGWSRTGTIHVVSFPIAGFLWLWLAAEWFARSRRDELHPAGGNDVSRRVLIQRVAILVGLLSIILAADQHFRRARSASFCGFRVRMIQQTVRSAQGMKNWQFGSPLPWEEILGPEKFLAPDSARCSDDEPYRLSPVVPYMGQLAAECPNPEHQRRLRATVDTSNW